MNLENLINSVESVKELDKRVQKLEIENDSRGGIKETLTTIKTTIRLMMWVIPLCLGAIFSTVQLFIALFIK